MDRITPRIDAGLVHKLLTHQFPQWADLPVRPVSPQGWDNRMFCLGKDRVVRLPTTVGYSAQVEKEHHWLPKLAPLLPLAIPAPLVMGQPGDGYPWKWSVYRWIQGEPAQLVNIGNLDDFATRLAGFILALQRIEPAGGPAPGAHNFYRGGALQTYDGETRRAIAALKGKIDTGAATNVWDTALGTTWGHGAVWLHGDMSAGNLLVRKGRLRAVIDFGMLAVGDPACDLSIAWTLFSGASRETFHKMLSLDHDTWARGRAWTLWKALIIAAGLSKTSTVEGAQCWRVIDEVLGEGSIEEGSAHGQHNC